MLFLDDFLEMLDELPAELKERGDEIRRIDVEVESRLNRNKEAINDFFERSGVNMTDDQRKDRFKVLQDEYATIRLLAQRKYFIAEKMQELLKKYQVHLEKEKTNFQCEMEADNSGVTEMIEKRYTQHLESVLTARKERKRRHRNGGGGGSSRASTVASGPLLSRESNDKIQKILQDGMRLRLDFSDESAAHSAMSSAIPSPAPRGRPPKAKDPLMLSSAMMASDDCLTPVPTPSARRRSNTNALRGTVSIPSMHRSESSGRYSPNPSERSWSNAGIDESPTPTNLITPTFSSGPHTIGPNFSTPQSSQVLQNSAFVVSESRHGRTRKLTSRVQEMFKETLQRQRNHGNSIIALQERMSAANLAAQQNSAASPIESESPMNTTRNGSPIDDDDDSSYGRNRGRDSFHMNPSDDEEEEDTRTWCFCNEKSYGDMVRCDNTDCTLRWFHYPCIGIVDPPVGKWYCPRCIVTQQLDTKMNEDGDDV